MRQVQIPDNSGSFLIRSIQHYNTMMTDICLNKKKSLDKLSEIESCFQIATHYQNILMNELSHYQFDSQRDEIFFFKKIKPLFTGEIEFYGLYNYAEIFYSKASENEDEDIERFYKKEIQRMEKFEKEHGQFYSYIKSDRTEMDAEWFTGLENDKTSSLYDELMGTYFAIEKYVETITDKMKLIQKKPNELSDRRSS